MQTISEALGRIASYLDEYKKTNKANDARKIGEAICRVILLNSENKSTNELSNKTKYQELIESISKSNLKEDENHLKKIKTDLRIIQDLGNIDSHDNHAELTISDLESINRSVKNLLRNVFDSKEYIDIDEKIPLSIYTYIEKSITENENWRCDKIISLVYPNRDIVKIKEHKDFQFYTIPDVNHKKVGFVFLGRNISFSESLHDLFTNNESAINDLISLTFLFPKEISRTTGNEVKNRKRNIKSKCERFITSSHPKVAFTCEFIEDYIWDHCLINSLKAASNVTTEQFFIDQWLYKENTEKLSLDFIDDIIKNTSNDEKPIYIIIGDGGVGKTTFCAQAVQKIDQLLAQGAKKKALLLSSFDLPEELNNSDEAIDSIQSLYRVLQDDPDKTLNSQNLGLNISSGNILIIIDGLDEIESKLKERFNLESFINSVIELNDTYLNCAVIITSRDNNSEKFDRKKVNVYQLLGFDNQLIEKYLKTRYDHKSKHVGKGYDAKVLSYISSLSLDNNKKVTPLIMRLLCELVESQGDNQSIKDSDESQYFQMNSALDKVVYQIINRDIIKQEIDIPCDEYFMVMKEIVFDNNCLISKNDFDELIELSLINGSNNKSNGNNKKNYTNFYVSPLFQRVGDNFKIKYDSLEFWIKARYIIHQIQTQDREVSNNVINLISKECYQGGALVKEINSYIKSSKYDYFKSIIQDISKELLKSNINISSNIDISKARKTISSILYLAMSSENSTKEELTSILHSLFGTKPGERIKFLSIFGDFFPLDFRNFSVVDGYFSGYTNLAKSIIPEDKTVFIDCEFRNLDESNFGKNLLSNVNFNNCVLPDGIKNVINSGEQSKQEQIFNIRSDLVKIFKVGFKQSSFVWKSEGLYKQQCASLKHNLILSRYLTFLENENYLHKEPSKGSAGTGFRLCSNKENEVKDFVTQGIISTSIQSLIDKLVR
ncbi:NACHT domain-containing protein [Nitrosomonas aestuarii]|uniref:NACHT domain-containing protein n=1 Tax=Nitrosomonas aestuarii TaxID=52441 RepID=UPI000D2FBD4E|nr:NACHT domain-containing protein [Nitrosomonas aestuarii]PTN11557.1 NACHT domain-containing protein [Nitrosomonas aestuarii]